MKALIFSLSLLLPGNALLAQRFTAPPDVPLASPNSEYPVHVHILGVHWNHVNGGYEGYGRGNILGNNLTGFDYTFSCSEPFLHNAQPEEFYQARWKKQDQKLELLMQKVGTDHEQKCELKTALKTEPYGHSNRPAAAPLPSSPGVPQH